MSITVETRFGRVRSSTDRGVFAFRNVPYAAPPMGKLRFAPPAKPVPWASPRDGHGFGAAAPQSAPRLASIYETRAPIQSEDCLTLNVWTPDLEGLGRPVMVWLHPGGWVEGAASEPGYGARALARRGDVVVVTVQYRLGLLGFSSFASVTNDPRLQTANLGLLDQIAALEWIRDEIDAFGGDPEQVTLVGSSAGATAAACLLTAPRAAGLVHRAVLQSGTYRVSVPDEAERIAQVVLDELSLPRDKAATLLDLPVSALLGAQRRAAVRLAHEEINAFRPVVDGDTLPAAPLDAIAAGRGARVPTIVGCNRNEARIFAAAEPKLLRLDDAGLRSRLERDLPVGRIEEAIALYARERPKASPAELWFAIQTDLRFRVPAARLAAAQSRHVAKTYGYLFAWTPSGSSERFGAFHGLEVPFVLGTRRQHALGRFVGRAPEAKALSRCMRDAWTSFARTGSPRCPIIDWPAFDEDRREVLVFDNKPAPVAGAFEADRALFPAPR